MKKYFSKISIYMNDKTVLKVEEYSCFNIFLMDNLLFDFLNFPKLGKKTGVS